VLITVSGNSSLNASKHKSSDAGNSDLQKRSHKVLPLSKDVKSLTLKKKNHVLSYSNNKFSIHEIVKKEKEISASFVTLQRGKVIVTVHDKCC
jgi:hypothetical protein